jgi:hypothetical protein
MIWNYMALTSTLAIYLETQIIKGIIRRNQELLNSTNNNSNLYLLLYHFVRRITNTYNNTGIVTCKKIEIIIVKLLSLQPLYDIHVLYALYLMP